VRISTANRPSAGSNCSAYPSSRLSFTANSNAIKASNCERPILRQHAQALAPSGAARRLVARGIQQLIVFSQQAQYILAQRVKILSGRAAKAFENPFKERTQHQKLLRQTVAQTQPRAVGKDQRRDGQRNDNAQDHFGYAMQRKRPMRAGF
jgi:hypothetical protein